MHDNRTTSSTTFNGRVIIIFTNGESSRFTETHTCLSEGLLIVGGVNSSSDHWSRIFCDLSFYKSVNIHCIKLLFVIDNNKHMYIRRSFKNNNKLKESWYQEIIKFLKCFMIVRIIYIPLPTLWLVGGRERSYNEKRKKIV